MLLQIFHHGKNVSDKENVSNSKVKNARQIILKCSFPLTFKNFIYHLFVKKVVDEKKSNLEALCDMYMVAAGLGFERAMVGTGWATSTLIT